MKKLSVWFVVLLIAVGFPAGAHAQTSPDGLVAAYGFNEGSGNTVSDASGNSNTGTIVGATWTTAGRYGDALVFDGGNDWVDVSDADSLDLTNGMTLEAWVYPTSLSGWRTVIFKERPGGLAYALYAHDNAPRPAVYINTGGGDRRAMGLESIPLNTWTHLAGTYDGVSLKLFVNGIEVGTRVVSGAIEVSPDSLRIGGNAVWGEYLSGRIDEVRVYNRALSQSEIQSDMFAAVSTDTTPPSAPLNLTATAVSSSEIRLSWTASTDDVEVTGYEVERCEGAGCSDFSLVTVVEGTAYNDIGLSTGTMYLYRVRARDAAGNVSLYSEIASAVLQAAGPEPADWYAGDMHVHRSCGGSPEAVSSLYAKMSTHDLAVIALLADMGNGEVQDPVTDLPLVDGYDDPVSTPGRIVHWDAEWHWDATYYEYDHQALGGHVLALGLTEAYQVWEEYTYPIFEWAHQQNAIAGFAHMQYLDNDIPQALNCCIPIEYPVEVALGAADFVSEDVNGDEAAIQAYYRLLNCGFRPGLAAGTDYPCNGGAALGSLLTYVQVPGPGISYFDWIEGIAAGRTVISRNGHNEFLDLQVDGSAIPGDEIHLTGPASVSVTVQWTATKNLTGTIELVNNGVVVASEQASVAPDAPANLDATVDFPASGWLAARRMAGNEHAVHTAAVFVTVNDASVRASQADAEFYVDWMDNLLEKTSPGGAWAAYFIDSLDEARARYQAAKEIYEQIALEASLQPSTLGITTTSLPLGILDVAYSAPLAATGGSMPYSWSLIDGSLPPDLVLDSETGMIAGTPTAIGTFDFTAQVIDSGSPAQTAVQALSITVVDDGPTPEGLVAAYGFNEGSGDIVSDASGNLNTGTIVGATWTTAGRFGHALVFDGSNDWVDVSDADSLDLTSGMTLEAWVYPSALSDWRTVVLKERPGGLAYALYASDHASRPAVYINTGAGDLYETGTDRIPLGTWTHLAATYDGVTLTLFVNGTEVASGVVGGAIQVSTGSLRIGGNAVWGEYLSGRIDEVRIYNRALSQSEIQIDMNSAVAGEP